MWLASCIVFASKDIAGKTELRYDYGSSDLPWRLVCIELLFFGFSISMISSF